MAKYVYVYTLRSQRGVTVHETREEAEFCAKHLKQRHGIRTAVSEHVLALDKLREEVL